jgi:hypothetical protein
MNLPRSIITGLAAATLLCAAAAAVTRAPASRRAQSQSQSQPPSSSPSQSQSSMPGMDMSEMQHETDQNPEAAKAANDAMDMPGLDMAANPHMFMTELAPKQPGDDRRAAEIVEILGKSIARYRDYKVALADNYKIFLPNVKQPVYHFTNYRNAIAAEFIFNPAHPTSLLYKKSGEGYELVGAMFTAPKSATEQQLNERVPLSIARWHEHVNFCLPPRGTPPAQIDWKKFGLAGSIASPDACAQANGRFIKQIFGWMVHVYPFEQDPEKLWAH